MESGNKKGNQPKKPDENVCPQCGSETVPGENYCPNCGHQLQQTPEQPVTSQTPQPGQAPYVAPGNQQMPQYRAPVCPPTEVHSGWLIGIGGAVLVIVGLLLTLSGLAVADAFTLVLGLVCLAFGVLLLVQAFRHSTTRATT